MRLKVSFCFSLFALFVFYSLIMAFGNGINNREITELLPAQSPKQITTQIDRQIAYIYKAILGSI
jgi:hypothetical protein